MAGLIDGGDLHGIADADFAAVGFFQSGQHAEQRGLAGAVRADDADDARPAESGSSGRRSAAGRRKDLRR